MESEQHLLDLSTLELIRMLQDLKDENEALQETSILNGNLVVKYENTMRLIQRNYPVEDVDFIPITALYEIQKIIKDSLV